MNLVRTKPAEEPKPNTFLRQAQTLKARARKDDGNQRAIWLGRNLFQRLQLLLLKGTVEEEVLSTIFKCLNQPVELAGCGEPCAIAGEDCVAPAGWSVGGGVVENTSLKLIRLPYCARCSEPVCDVCSRMIEGQRVCADCLQLNQD